MAESGLTRSDDRGYVAATFALLSDSAASAGERRLLLQCADRIAAGEDVADAGRRLPGRMRALVESGARHGLLSDFLAIERQNDLERRDRDRMAREILGYHVMLLVVIVVLLWPAIVAGLSIGAPFYDELIESSGDERLSNNYRGFVLAVCLFNGVATLLLGTLLVAKLVKLFRGEGGPALWTRCIPGGHRVRRAEACVEAFRFTAAFVVASKPLPDAFDAIQGMAHSADTRRMASTGAQLAVAGCNPIEAFRPSAVVSGAFVSPEEFRMPLEAKSLRDTAEILAEAANVEAENGLKMSRAGLIIVIGLLMLTAFWLCTAPMSFGMLSSLSQWL